MITFKFEKLTRYTFKTYQEAVDFRAKHHGDVCPKIHKLYASGLPNISGWFYEVYHNSCMMTPEEYILLNE